MIKETRQLFCDICGKEITWDDYSCRREVIEIDEDGYAQSVGYDMCKDCTDAFNDWKKQRRALYLGTGRGIPDFTIAYFKEPKEVQE